MHMSKCRHYTLLCEIRIFFIELLDCVKVNVNALVGISLLVHVELRTTAQPRYINYLVLAIKGYKTLYKVARFPKF